MGGEEVLYCRLRKDEGLGTTYACMTGTKALGGRAINQGSLKWRAGSTPSHTYPT
jgi:hypothetical protein